MPQPTQRIHETNPIWENLLAAGGLTHHPPHQVVRQHEDLQFLDDARHRGATQHIETQGLFEVAEIGFHLPALAEQPRQGPRRVTAVHERRHQVDFPGPASRDAHRDPQFAHYQRGR